MGKVHGSLTRAGKVKNQTKFIVPKQKKKSLSGRAKLRKKYRKKLTIKKFFKRFRRKFFH